MSTLNLDGPIYTGPEHLEARPHAMNGLGDSDIPPRVVLDVPGLSIVLTADDADAVARALREQAGQARRVHCDALVAANEPGAAS